MHAHRTVRAARGDSDPPWGGDSYTRTKNKRRSKVGREEHSRQRECHGQRPCGRNEQGKHKRQRAMGLEWRQWEGWYARRMEGAGRPQARPKRQVKSAVFMLRTAETIGRV